MTLFEKERLIKKFNKVLKIFDIKMSIEEEKVSFFDIKSKKELPVFKNKKSSKDNNVNNVDPSFLNTNEPYDLNILYILNPRTKESVTISIDIYSSHRTTIKDVEKIIPIGDNKFRSQRIIHPYDGLDLIDEIYKKDENRKTLLCYDIFKVEPGILFDSEHNFELSREYMDGVKEVFEGHEVSLDLETMTAFSFKDVRKDISLEEMCNIIDSNSFFIKSLSTLYPQSKKMYEKLKNGEFKITGIGYDRRL